MAQHNQILHNPSQQQQKQPPPPPSLPQKTHQSQLVGLQPQVQLNQSTQQTSQTSNYPLSHPTQTHAFGQVSPSGVYLHPHGVQPVGGAVYHMLSAASLPSSVYVHNVTANVNLHGYPVPQYIPGTSPTFISNETQLNISHPSEQNTSVMQNTTNTSVPRNQRRSRGRGNSGNSRRCDYNQRQQQSSPAPQEVLNSQTDPQMLGGFIQYGYPYQCFGAPAQNIAHSQAQQATGSPLYIAANHIPMYATGPQIYGYPGMIYHPTLISQEYTMMDEKVEDHAEVVIPQMWSMSLYHEDYVGQEIVQDVNHNQSPLPSSDTSNMLSPSYPIYNNQIQTVDLQQQINAMHIYEAQPSSTDEQVQVCPLIINALSCEQQMSGTLSENNSNDQDNNIATTAIKKNDSTISDTPTLIPYLSEHLEQNIKSVNAKIENQDDQLQNKTDLRIKHNVNNLTASNFESGELMDKNLNQNVPNKDQEIIFKKMKNTDTIEKQLNNETINTSSFNETSNTNKIMWVNQSKKSMASVAVTATPSSTNKSFSMNNQNYTKNYGVIKTPLSPAVDVNSERNLNIESEKTVSTNSIASSATPEQFQEIKISNQIQFSSDIKKGSQVYNVKKGEIKTETKDEAIINNSQAPPSWASLFANKSNTEFSKSSVTNQTNTHTISSMPSKKPIAKVLPFEGTSNFTPPITPGNMSYSAASAQGLVNSRQKSSSNNMLLSSASNLSKETIDEWSIKFADFLVKHKIDYSPISLKPRGLTNRSNYCYINAILQALIGCPPFYNLMRSIPKQSVALMSEKINTPTINAMMQLVSEFSFLPPGIRLSRREKGKKKDDLSTELSCDPSFEPTGIYKLWNSSRTDVEGRQEDAEEFLGYVLNKLNDEMLEVIKLISKPVLERNGESNVDGDDGGEDWQMIYNNKNKGSITRQTDFGRTPLSDIFRGELRSRLQREGEHSVTDVIQPFFTLQLNIEKAASVKEALEILVGRDQLEGVTCSKTNQEVVAWQQMTLEKLPVVLILHLKWFDYKMDGCTKIFKTVEFPVELKIDTKILASKKYSQKQKLYRLFAVVYHDGKEASKGHYITDVYHTGYSNWLRYDDSSVKPVTENNVLRPRAPRVPYLLYYRRYDTVPVQNITGNK